MEWKVKNQSLLTSHVGVEGYRRKGKEFLVGSKAKDQLSGNQVARREEISTYTKHLTIKWRKSIND